MMITRLQSKDPDVAQRLMLATSLQRRRIAIAAAEWALRMNSLNELELIDVTKSLRENAKLSADGKLKLEALVKEFDDECFEVENSGAAERDYMQLFGKARAVSALLFAAGDDSFTAAAEAIYEASVATDDEKQLFDLVHSYLP
ncbi:hypothetical protein J2X92_002941 [Variovorax paradoxus]|nr:hypothetical protein [Variovorax paradoxus]